MGHGNPQRGIEQVVRDLVLATDRGAQTALKQELKAYPDQADRGLVEAMRRNPFVQLTASEIADFEMRRRYEAAEKDLMILRQFATQLGGRRIAVFAMPKSGSSLVQSGISHAARLPLLSLTSVAGDGGRASSRLGMNGREQELDELAILLQSYRTHGNWVAQHHTRFTPYLGSQISLYRITPVVTVRNILDAIVSMDDMMMGWRSTSGWWSDPPHGCPLDYHELEPDERLTILAQDFGIWLISFLVSWRRAPACGCEPLIISYERDVLDPPALAQRLADHLRFGDTERAELQRFLTAPGDSKVRFNKGVAGRGARVPQAAQAMLIAHAERFHADLGNAGMELLFGGAQAPTMGESNAA